MGDNPTFVLDEPDAHSNGPARASSEAAETDFHDTSFSLVDSPTNPKKKILDPSGAQAKVEVAGIKSLESGHVVLQIGQSDVPQSLGTESVKQGESTVEQPLASGGSNCNPEGSNLSTSAGTSKVTSTGTKKGTNTGTNKGSKSKRRESIISEATSNDFPSIGKKQGKGKGKITTEDDVITSLTVGEDELPWYMTMSEFYKVAILGTCFGGFLTYSFLSPPANSSQPVKRASVQFEAIPTAGRRASVQFEAIPAAGRRASVQFEAIRTAGRRSSMRSEAIRNAGRRASVQFGAIRTEGKRASVKSAATQTATEGSEVEEEDEEWDEEDEDEQSDEEDYDDQDYEDDEESESENMLYTINDNPPWYLGMGLGFQHYLTMVGSTITIPFILTPELCIQQDDPARGFILSTIFFVSGIVTFLQVTFGVRLPIVQGGSFAFFAPTLVILQTGFPACASLDVNDLTTFQRQEEWQSRMREIQGAIIAAALIEMLIGFSGLMGLVVSLITPLAIAPTVCLVGLALFDVAAKKAASHWGISVLTILLMILFSQYMRNVKVPIPVYRNKKGFSIVAANIFGLFPVLLTILLSWALCAILTATDSLPEGSAARTDTAGRLIADSPWIRVPYPGQWGWPTVSAASVLGILAALLASIVESVGDYYACARLAGAPPPPRHAINRGIGFEGFGCLLAGLWGTGNGTSSYSENIGAIGITKVGSRRVIQYGAGIMIVCGVLGKFAAVFVTIPEPVVGGIFCVMFAMITAVGLSSLQNVDLKSSRNLFVLGFPIFFGLALPKWLENNPGLIQSVRYPVMAQVVTVLLKTSMFVGGLLGIILDNTIPVISLVGDHVIPAIDFMSSERSEVKSAQHTCTDRERGVYNLRHTADYEDPSGVYDFPVGMSFIKRFHWLSKIPFCPTYRGWHFKKKE